MQGENHITILITDKLKALGGRWDSARKGWMVPDEKATEAQELVNSAFGRLLGSVHGVETIVVVRPTTATMSKVFPTHKRFSRCDTLASEMLP